MGWDFHCKTTVRVVNEPVKNPSELQLPLQHFILESYPNTIVWYVLPLKGDLFLVSTANSDHNWQQYLQLSTILTPLWILSCQQAIMPDMVFSSVHCCFFIVPTEKKNNYDVWGLNTIVIQGGHRRFPLIYSDYITYCIVDCILMMIPTWKPLVSALIWSF